MSFVFISMITNILAPVLMGFAPLKTVQISFWNYRLRDICIQYIFICVVCMSLYLYACLMITNILAPVLMGFAPLKTVQISFWNYRMRACIKLYLYILFCLTFIIYLHLLKITFCFYMYVFRLLISKQLYMEYIYILL